MNYEVIFQGERCMAIQWNGVKENTDAAPFRCDSYSPIAAQVSGLFNRSFVMGSIDGVDYDSIAALALDGVAKIDVSPLYIKPLVSGGEATITVMLRR